MFLSMSAQRTTSELSTGENAGVRVHLMLQCLVHIPCEFPVTLKNLVFLLQLVTNDPSNKNFSIMSMYMYA